MSCGSNRNLIKAKMAKNDEFYTQLSDIEKELKHYRRHLKNKIVFCNCDDPTYSNFWKYFHLNFGLLELKKLVATHYSKDESSYKMEYSGGNDADCEFGLKIPLKGNGDFRSQECADILQYSSIVVTNPPFSLFREYVAQLVEFNKKFIIIGNMNAITYKEIFPLIKNNKLWLGHNHVKEFMQRNGIIKKFGNVIWYTNCSIPKQQEELHLTGKYNPKKYPKYDNFDAINVDKVMEIPKDYGGVMGVPISFFDKYCPTQFEIVGVDRYVKDNPNYGKRFTINKKKIYARILIKKIATSN